LLKKMAAEDPDNPDSADIPDFPVPPDSLIMSEARKREDPGVLRDPDGSGKLLPGTKLPGKKGRKPGGRNLDKWLCEIADETIDGIHISKGEYLMRRLMQIAAKLDGPDTTALKAIETIMNRIEGLPRQRTQVESIGRWKLNINERGASEGQPAEGNVVDAIVVDGSELPGEFGGTV
jgi:hypothetical protein